MRADTPLNLGPPCSTSGVELRPRSEYTPQRRRADAAAQLRGDDARVVARRRRARDRCVTIRSLGWNGRLVYANLATSKLRSSADAWMTGARGFAATTSCLTGASSANRSADTGCAPGAAARVSRTARSTLTTPESVRPAPGRGPNDWSRSRRLEWSAWTPWVVSFTSCW